MIFGGKKAAKDSRTKTTPAAPADEVAVDSAATTVDETATKDDSNEEGGLFSRLGRTRALLGSGINRLLGGGARIDDSLFDALEDELLSADVGVDASLSIVDSLRARARAGKLESVADLKRELRAEMVRLLQAPLDKHPRREFEASPSVLLMVGVNGVGKTTSVAKLAARAQALSRTVIVAAADTFRAAAIEQLQSWGKELDIPVIAQAHGSDAAAVAHDAVNAAVARAVDLLIIDTAGRQHTHGDLMEQLAKVVRVIQKVDASAPHETFIVVDAGNGQNILSQIEQFSTVVPITGVVVTKLDGTAKGGVLLAVATKFGLPVRFIGVGEGINDLRPFDPTAFASALLPD